MPVLFGLLLFASVVLSLACGSKNPQPVVSSPVDLLVRNVTVVSAERLDPLPGAWVAVSDGRLVALGQGNPSLYQAAEEIDGKGMFLTPGLIDGHVHLANVAGLDGLPADAPDSLQPAINAYVQQLPRSYLFFGFTTLIDLNVVDRDFLERFERSPVAPDLYHCGGALALANGYPMAWLPEPIRFDAYPNFLWDERQTEQIPERFSRAEHTPSAAVERVANDGGICVKAHWEDGFGPQKIWPTPTPELIEAVVEESHARGLTATLHANSYESHRFATEVGVDVIVHGLWNWDGMQAAEGLPEPITALLQEEIERGVGVMPTTRVLAGLRDLFDASFLDDPRLADAVPRELIDWYRTEEGRFFVEQMRADFGGADDETIFRSLASAVEAAQRVTGFLAENDGRLLFGSDTPSAPTYANPPGLNGVLEMELLAQAGLTPRQILETVTRATAQAFHLEDEVGTVEIGKQANLLLLRTNPLESVAAWSQIETVIVRGVAIERSTLSSR